MSKDKNRVSKADINTEVNGGIVEADDELVEKLRETDIDVPDSLRPENIGGLLEGVTPDDVTSDIHNAATQKTSDALTGDEILDVNTTERMSFTFRKFIYPLAAAAALLIAAGIGYGVAQNRNLRSDNPESIEATDDSSDEAATSVSEYEEYTATVSEDSVEGTAGVDAPEASGISEDTSSVADGVDVSVGYEKAYELLSSMGSYYKYDILTNDAIDTAEYVTDAFSEAAVIDDAAATETAADGDYTSTNVRTDGVDEGDIVKTDGEYLYVYDTSSEHVRIYSINAGRYELVSSVNTLFNVEYGSEMYVSGDRLIIIGNTNDDSYNVLTTYGVYDISDRENVSLIDTAIQDGGLTSSRLKDGVLYIFSSVYIDTYDIEEDDYDTYIPSVNGNLVDDKDVLVQNDVSTSQYVVITSMNIDTGVLIDRKAVLGGSDDLYVSSDSIYLLDEQYDWNSYSFQNMTVITRMSYSEGSLKVEASGTVNGYTNDYYSIDEYNGYVRVVTTYTDSSWTDYNALTILDTDLSKVSVIRRIAEGETIRSARFMGNMLYFVTFRNTDPLFAVDVSDPENPSILGYLKIPGFSAYLHPYGDGMLLGIGYDMDDDGFVSGIKLSMFDISDPENIEEVDKTTIPYESADVINDTRTLMFDSTDNIFGFQVAYPISSKSEWGYNADNSKTAYVVYSYEDGFRSKLLYEYDTNNFMSVRGVVVDGYLYVISVNDDEIVTFDISDYSVVTE